MIIERKKFMIQNKESIKKLLKQIKKIILEENINIKLYDTLHNLELTDLCEFANIIESILINIDKITWKLVNFIDVEIRIEILDELYYDNIKDFKQYIYEKLNKIEKYLDNDINEDINKVFSLNNQYDNINYKTYINMSLTDKESIINNILEIFKVLNEFKKEYLKAWNLFQSPRKPYAYKVMKLLIYDLKEYILKVKNDLETNNNYKELLIDMTKTLKNILKEDTELIIDVNEIFKENISQINYKILDEYNCIEKIGLFKYPSFCSIDLSDVFYFFKNSQIIKIIDEGKENIINEGNPNIVFYINLKKDLNKLGFKKLRDELDKDLVNYNFDDCLSYEGKGNNKKLIIMLKIDE